jgi:hypothetical protein
MTTHREFSENEQMVMDWIGLSGRAEPANAIGRETCELLAKDGLLEGMREYRATDAGRASYLAFLAFTRQD